MTCQHFQHSPNLFGDCEAYGVWPSKSFHPVLLWPFCVLPRVFSVCAMSDPNVNTITIFTFDLLHDFSGSPFLDLVFWLFKYARDGADRLMGDLDVETSKNFCDSLGKFFGIGQDNQATLVGIIHFLLSIRLAAILNEISRAIISGEGFRYSLGFP